jgi:hypothetical protein
VSIQNTELSDHERLVVSPRRAALMLDCGVTRVYEMMNDGKLQSFKDGAARKITVESLRQYVASKLTQAA